MPSGMNVLLIVGGGIAAYKCLELIRHLGQTGCSVTPVLTEAAEQFVTPLSLSALAAAPVRRKLFDADAEAAMDHIQLSRAADIVVVAPATADLLAKMANGLADDLASTVLLATDKPVLAAPAMNVRMWRHAATQRNIEWLRQDGINFVGPNHGEMACREFGPGRMAEPAEIADAIDRVSGQGPLLGKRILVTSGPTREAIDPVRFISNRSSGRQGTEIARALIGLGAEVVFVTGPASIDPPTAARAVRVETAEEMMQAVDREMPVDAAVFTAAVADWKVASRTDSKIKKRGGESPALQLVENPDILASVAARAVDRPPLVIGFAAETDNVIKNAAEKRARKGCDWIVANDVSSETGIVGGSENQPVLITSEGAESLPRMLKAEFARLLAARIARELTGG